METENFFSREDEILEIDNQVSQDLQSLPKEKRSALFKALFALPRAEQKKESDGDIKN